MGARRKALTPAQRHARTALYVTSAVAVVVAAIEVVPKLGGGAPPPAAGTPPAVSLGGGGTVTVVQTGAGSRGDVTTNVHLPPADDRPADRIELSDVSVLEAGDGVIEFDAKFRNLGRNLGLVTRARLDVEKVWVVRVPLVTYPDQEPVTAVYEVLPSLPLDDPASVETPVAQSVAPGAADRFVVRVHAGADPPERNGTIRVYLARLVFAGNGKADAWTSERLLFLDHAYEFGTRFVTERSYVHPIRGGRGRPSSDAERASLRAGYRTSWDDARAVFRDVAARRTPDVVCSRGVVETLRRFESMQFE